ncbi:MAG: chemotaxis protein CheA [Bacillota bacterium]
MLFDDQERRELIKEFLTEGRELLDEVEPQIITMEQSAVASGEVNIEILNAIFRLFHTLKGAAGFLDFPTVVAVTHEAETLLDMFRKGKADVEPGHVDLLCRTSDLIRIILDSVEQQFHDRGFETDAGAIIDDLKKTMTIILSGKAAPPVIERGDAGPTGGVEEETTDDADEINLEITPELVRRFAEEAISLCEEAETALLALERTPDDQEQAGNAFRALHSLKGNAGFLGYGDLEEISHQAETVLDVIRNNQKDCDSITISFLLIAADALREGVRQINSGLPVDIPGKEELIKHLTGLSGETDGPQTSEPAGKESDKAGPSETGKSAGSEPAMNDNPEKACKNKGNGGAVKTEDTRGNGDARERQPSFGQQQVIRVDIEKLDKLLDLVGELVIAEAMVGNAQDLNGMQFERFEKSVLRLDKITREIQEVAMAMRMIPLSGTFRKMMRLVRDLAHKADKKVDLHIVGEETEVDKTIIEQISDPLVHIIRNAVDHGIESPGDRRAAGKPETGRITIEAKHSVGEVWIVVEDDGRGLNREKILRKGVEKGLIKNEDRDLKDEEVWRLIFEPGFSTAEIVSNVSGRGVGMDVVKRNIEKLRGRVDVRSRLGAGTMFVIRIPLTLAIIEGMVVRVGRNRYTIPIGSIKESFQPKEGQITRTPDSLEVVSIRGELLPVIRLHELYAVEPNYRMLTDGILIMVENEQQKYCLFVDELIGQQQVVIKGLASYLGHVKSISGCAILGDGDISMILDIADLINSVEGVASQVH